MANYRVEKSKRTIEVNTEEIPNGTMEIDVYHKVVTIPERTDKTEIDEESLKTTRDSIQKTINDLNKDLEETIELINIIKDDKEKEKNKDII
jgi:hypothetical protein